MAQRASVEVYMDRPVNAFDLLPEQQETASLLQRLLGSAIANRYVDFYLLAAGAFALRTAKRSHRSANNCARSASRIRQSTVLREH